MVRIVVIGNINIDLIAFLDELPGLDEGREAKDWKLLPGGSGSNFSVAARSLGAEVELYSAVGTGYFSKVIVEELERLGIKVYGTLKEGEQSLIFIASTPKGKVMFSLKGVSHMLRPEDLPESFGADILHVATKPPEFPRKYVGKERISYSPGSHTFGHEDEIREIIPDLDFVFINEAEAKALRLYPSPDVLPKTALVVTLGEKGSMIFARGRRLKVGAFPVENVVDTTGAGDVYAAAFLTRYLETGDLVESAKFASAAGAIAVTTAGGFVLLDRQSLESAAKHVRVEEMRTSPTPER